MYVGTKHAVFSSGKGINAKPSTSKPGTDAGGTAWHSPARGAASSRIFHIMPCIIPHTHKPMQRRGGATLQETTNKRPKFFQKQESHLYAEFLDVGLLALEGQRNDTTDVHLRAVDVHVKTQLNTGGLDVLETLLVVRTGTADPDLDLVLDEDRGDITDGTNDTLESAGNVGEVGNTTTDEEDLTLGVLGSTEHEVQDGASVLEGLVLGGSTGVLSVVGELGDEASGGNGVGVDDGSTTTSNEGPDTAAGVQDSELKGGTGLGVHVGDELLLLAQLTTEGGGELHRRTSVDVDLAVGGGENGHTQSSGAASDGPLGTALELSSLVDLGSQIQEVNIGGGGIGVGNDNKRVDLEVGELAVDVDGVQTGDEVHQDVVDTLGHLAQEGGGNLLVGGEVLQVDGNKQLLGLSIDITDVNTTLVGEENPVTL